MTPIDSALAELLQDLGNDWFLSSVWVEEIDTTIVGGKRTIVSGRATVILKHPEGLTSEGTAHTIGNAAAMAVANILKQELRTRSAGSG